MPDLGRLALCHTPCLLASTGRRWAARHDFPSRIRSVAANGDLEGVHAWLSIGEIWMAAHPDEARALLRSPGVVSVAVDTLPRWFSLNRHLHLGFDPIQVLDGKAFHAADRLMVSAPLWADAETSRRLAETVLRNPGQQWLFCSAIQGGALWMRAHENLRAIVDQALATKEGCHALVYSMAGWSHLPDAPDILRRIVADAEPAHLIRGLASHSLPHDRAIVRAHLANENSLELTEVFAGNLPFALTLARDQSMRLIRTHLDNPRVLVALLANDDWDTSPFATRIARRLPSLTVRGDSLKHRLILGAQGWAGRHPDLLAPVVRAASAMHAIPPAAARALRAALPSEALLTLARKQPDMADYLLHDLPLSGRIPLLLRSRKAFSAAIRAADLSATDWEIAVASPDFSFSDAAHNPGIPQEIRALSALSSF